MKYRRLDVNGDMSFGAGVSNFLINSPEAVAQAVMTRLKLFQGEWFIDTEIGVPYNTKVLGFGNIHNYDFIIKQQILGTQGVSAIASYSSFIDDKRKANINATLDTLFGSTTIQATF